MLLQDNITNIRARAEKWLIDTCTVIPCEYTKDDSGGMTVSEGTSSETPCFFPKPKNMIEREQGGAVQIAREISIMFAAGTSITKQDRIEKEGRRYEIVDIENTSLTALLKVICKEVS